MIGVWKEAVGRRIKIWNFIFADPRGRPSGWGPRVNDPQTQVFQNLLNDRFFLDKRDDTHGATALRTQQRVYLVDFLDESCPVSAELFFTRQGFIGFWRG